MTHSSQTATATPAAESPWQKTRIFGMSLPIFALSFLVLIAAIATDTLPAGMIGALLVMMILGELLGFLGDRLPIINSYLGGGAILAIFGAAALVYSGWLPQEVTANVSEFMKAGGFLNFYIAALITGSILGMDSRVLVKVGARFALPLLCSVLFAALFAMLVGWVMGFSPKDAVMVIALPIMGGGMGAGAVPMSQIYEQLLGQPASYYISILVPALALGNVFAIIIAGLLNGLGKRFPSLTGGGQMMPGVNVREEKSTPDLSQLGIGMVIALSFFVASQILGKVIPLHPYALMIIAVAVLKCANLVPENINQAAAQWFRFVAGNWTFALLFGIGVAYTDLGQVIDAITITYVVIVFGVVAGAAFGAGLVGKLVGFYPIESAITAGLCMANMGGTGDVAVLSAANRMQLMPFAQISSRLGGALILLISSLVVPMWFA
ncbi:MAG: citrate:sodium symporter [Cobetia sp.]|jgi:CCS family citrate carrier protein|uniref:2-hydroxycarboxylate transporter family protein n=2 Tax=Halomonadaceae TaxID=28256 RepID=UPI0006C9FEA8|nr:MULTISPECIES: 2-hydroxycarboxylate transporter family protein [Cobetia]AVV33832.1 citrate:sodium symporter [Halomonas sp. SF2003]KPM81486.1 citrate:sodium symporter [Cobetia sp. UCD-24C]MBF09705.1 citrate:sodium symporter [Cobetia sp.]MBK08946.1 citrate:sodium symporter [Cobetia sp.]MCK8068723.1 2-hydroxycarboxylate transporter family protein [Cobetia sp. 1CM21F]|tara:strand:+ start:22466 stop:23776 length:1311 start_codon:yes stop_codon:yes gene_type:complete